MTVQLISLRTSWASSTARSLPTRCTWPFPEESSVCADAASLRTKNSVTRAEANDYAGRSPDTLTNEIIHRFAGNWETKIGDWYILSRSCGRYRYQSEICSSWRRAERPYGKVRIMASRSVNKVILIGHLGRDAETSYTPSQTALTKFSVATSRRWKDQQSGEWKEETDWTRVVLWRGENVAPYLVKGTQIYVEGRLQTRSYDDKDGKRCGRRRWSPRKLSCSAAEARLVEAGLAVERMKAFRRSLHSRRGCAALRGPVRQRPSPPRR